MHTSQLQRIPRTKATSNGRLHLALAMAAAAGALPSVPLLNTRYARRREPTKFPMYDAVQFLIRSFGVAFPSATAAVTKAVFPVKSSPPVTTVIMRPNGSPNAPKIIYRLRIKYHESVKLVSEIGFAMVVLISLTF